MFVSAAVPECASAQQLLCSMVGTTGPEDFPLGLFSTCYPSLALVSPVVLGLRVTSSKGSLGSHAARARAPGSIGSLGSPAARARAPGSIQPRLPPHHHPPVGSLCVWSYTRLGYVCGVATNALFLRYDEIQCALCVSWTMHAMKLLGLLHLSTSYQIYLYAPVYQMTMPSVLA
eukprot:SAG25_NODE_763_length_5504_cov_4.689362_5_plen_174_part_00